MALMIVPILRFLGVFLLQVFVLNAIEPGFGIHIMVGYFLYMMFILITVANGLSGIHYQLWIPHSI